MDIENAIEIRPIRLDEWLPDRCLTSATPFDPNSGLPGCGCPGLNCTKRNNREGLVQLYERAINKYGCCGFVAWDRDRVVAYNNFFPKEEAKDIGFYGCVCDTDSGSPEKTLVHNCLTIIKGDYLRKGICSRLMQESVIWAKANGWKGFEVHLVLPDCDTGWQSSQKGCLSFWERLGFTVLKEYNADEETRRYYGVTQVYSMYLPLG